MYSYKIAPQQLQDLYHAREHLGKGPISKQVREAVDRYIKGVEAEIGAPISEIAEICEQHERESVSVTD